MIEKYLVDLEKRICPEVEEKLLSQWTDFSNDKINSGIFSPSRENQAPDRIGWPKISVNKALDDFELMALQQLAGCSTAIADGTGAALNVRANYGTGILSSVFGAEIFRMEDKLDTLPTTRPLPGRADAVKKILDNPVTDLKTGYGKRCLDMGNYFVELFKNYPKISKYVRVYHPDLQGPMDICELLWGSSLFINLVDTPGLVHSLLKRITDTYIRFMREWEQIVPPLNGCAYHWGMLHKGQIMLRDDSAMNLSPEMFDEFIKPYDQRLLDEFGGGAIHFCGRGDHYIDRLPHMPGINAVNLSQPECNDMERVFSNTVDRGIMLIGLQREAAESALSRGRNLHGRVHCR